MDKGRREGDSDFEKHQESAYLFQSVLIRPWRFLLLLWEISNFHTELNHFPVNVRCITLAV